MLNQTLAHAGKLSSRSGACARRSAASATSTTTTATDAAIEELEQLVEIEEAGYRLPRSFAQGTPDAPCGAVHLS